MKKLFFILFTILTLVSCSEDEQSLPFGPITFSEITRNSITLNWEYGIEKLDKLEVYRNEILISTIKNISTKFYKDTNLTPNTVYKYYVKAIIDNNNFIKINGTAKTKK